MKINIKATNIDLTPAISDYVEKKVSTLEKYLNGEIVAQVEVGKTSEHHKSGDIFRAEVHITGVGLDVYASSEQSDLYAAIDLVKEEMSTTLQRGKNKKEALYRRGARMIKDMLHRRNPFKRRS